MKTKEKSQFVWYAAHPKHGELIMVVCSDQAYRYTYIYAPRIIFERLGKRINPLLALELNFGPIGFVPRRYYEEAGFMVRTPLWIRILAMEDEHEEVLKLDENHVGQHDNKLCIFILGEWEKVYKTD